MGIKKALTWSLLTLLLTSPLLAAEAVITGPDQVRPGQFTVLSSQESTIADGGKGFWIPDPSLPEDWQSSECGGVLNTAFELPPGKAQVTYYFHYVAYDGDGHSVATKSILVKPKEGTPPPVDPPPIDSPSLVELKKKSDTYVVKANDSVTAKRLAAVLREIQPAPSIEATANLVRDGIEEVLLTREDAQRNSDWLSWRLAVNQEIVAIAPTNVPDYMECLQVLATSLESASMQSFLPRKTEPAVKLTVIVGPDCHYCDLWKQRELPKITDWEVTIQDATTRMQIPSFILKKGSSTKTFVGYTPYETLLSSLE